MMYISQRWLIVMCFGLFIGWTMSLPYEGPVLYALADAWHFDGSVFNTIAVGLVSAGMLCSALLVKTPLQAKKFIVLSAYAALLGSASFMILPVSFWLPSLCILAFTGGVFVPAWGSFYFTGINPLDRGRAVADVLIIGNVILTASAVLATFISAASGLLFCILLLLFTIGAVHQLDPGFTVHTAPDPLSISDQSKMFRIPFALFLGFIFLISLTSGIMFQVVYPYFSEYPMLSSIYTNLPYMAALYLMRTMPQTRNKNFTLYLGMSILGLSYVLLAFMDMSIWKFFLVMTPMLAACGIFDYFWWRTMGDLCPYGSTPSKVVGLSLFVNVFGVFCGGLLSRLVIETLALKSTDIAYFSLGFVFIIMAFFPLLNSSLGRLLTDHIFFLHYNALPTETKSTLINQQINTEALTDREKEIVELVLRGFTFKVIAETLIISENTVKTHSKNIYKKLGINTKYELIRQFSKA